MPHRRATPGTDRSHEVGWFPARLDPVGRWLPDFVLCTALLAPVGAAQSEPTPHDTLGLCWLNRLREEPKAFGKFVLDGNKPGLGEHVDWQMFAREVQALSPAPPLFFEMRLWRAARAHASYMIEAREYGHHETAGRPGFTGEWPHLRALAAGYEGNVAECSGVHGTSALEHLIGYFVDAGVPGKGTGGMQDPRAHRDCMLDPRWREVGVAFVECGPTYPAGRLSNVMEFGEAAGVERIVGGVVIDDRNGDAWYDLGEGLGGVRLGLGERNTVSLAAGSFRIDTGSKARTTELVATLGTMRIVHELPAGKAPVWLLLRLPVQEHMTALEQRIRRLAVDADRERRVLQLELIELRAPADADETALAASVAALKARTVAAFVDAPAASAQAQLAAALKEYGGTVVEGWLRQALQVDRLTRSVAAAKAERNAALRKKRAMTLAAEIEVMLGMLQGPELADHLRVIRTELSMAH